MAGRPRNYPHRDTRRERIFFRYFGCDLEKIAGDRDINAIVCLPVYSDSDNQNRQRAQDIHNLLRQ